MVFISYPLKIMLHQKILKYFLPAPCHAPPLFLSPRVVHHSVEIAATLLHAATALSRATVAHFHAPPSSAARLPSTFPTCRPPR
jgi:hypothetical protein